MTKLIRILIVASVGALVVALPGQAMARGHHKRGRHHARHHRGRTRVRDLHMTSGPVATISSFNNGTLTIRLTDGSTVSGQVTPRTEVECAPPASATPGTATTREDGGSSSSGSGSSSSGSDDGAKPAEPTEAPAPAEAPENQAAEAPENEAAKEASEEAEQQPCSTDALKPGTPVLEAKLLIGSSGSTFEKVELGS